MITYTCVCARVCVLVAPFVTSPLYLTLGLSERHSSSQPLLYPPPHSYSNKKESATQPSTNFQTKDVTTKIPSWPETVTTLSKHRGILSIRGRRRPFVNLTTSGIFLVERFLSLINYRVLQSVRSKKKKKKKLELRPMTDLSWTLTSGRPKVRNVLPKTLTIHRLPKGSQRSKQFAGIFIKGSDKMSCTNFHRPFTNFI